MKSNVVCVCTCVVTNLYIYIYTLQEKFQSRRNWFQSVLRRKQFVDVVTLSSHNDIETIKAIIGTEIPGDICGHYKVTIYGRYRVIMIRGNICRLKSYIDESCSILPTKICCGEHTSLMQATHFLMGGELSLYQLK